MQATVSDIIGIAVTDSGTYVAEKNTEPVKACHLHFFASLEPRAKGTKTKITTPIEENKPGPSKPSANYKRPIGMTQNEELDLLEAQPKVKRRRIGGSGSRTLYIQNGKAHSSKFSKDDSQEQRFMEPLTNPPRAPMPLLPGEYPLEVETYFAEGAAMELPEGMAAVPLVKPAGVAGNSKTKQGGKVKPTNAATNTILGHVNQAIRIPLARSIGSTSQPPLRFVEAVDRARRGMAKKARDIGGKELEQRAMHAAEAFEMLCLRDEGSGFTAVERKKVCVDYDAILRQIYPGLVIDPHILSARALEEAEGTGKFVCKHRICSFRRIFAII